MATPGPYLISVIPIARGVGSEELTYFSLEHLQAGTVVPITIRGKKARGIVTSVRPAREAKSELRTASWATKKISGKGAQLYLPAFIKIAAECANYFVGSTGSVLAAFHSPKEGVSATRLEPKEFSVGRPEPLVVQASFEERLALYRRLIRGEFARGNSVFVAVPEYSFAEAIVEELQKGIENDTVVAPARKGKKLTEFWRRATDLSHPTLIIAPLSYLSLPRPDIGAIIIERAGARSYKSGIRPFVDYRVVAERLAARVGARLYYGDLILPLSLLERLEERSVAPLEPPPNRIPGPPATILSLAKKTGVMEKRTFSVLHPDLERELGGALKNNERAFVFAARRGLSLQVVCNDCGTVVTCPRCESPLVLHDTPTREHVCHECGWKEVPRDRCKKCGGHRLASLGVGTERVFEAIREKFPGTQVVRLDSDAAKTPTAARAIVEKFTTADRAILIGTEMAVPYLPSKIPFVAIAGLDSLFSLPDIHITERIISLLADLKQRAERAFIIQTRHPDHSVFAALGDNILGPFVRKELELRKMLRFPPFFTLIKISGAGNAGTIEAAMRRVAEKFSLYKPELYPAFIGRVKNKRIIHILIRVPRSKWPEPELVALLRTLPPSLRIEVDPESIL